MFGLKALAVLAFVVVGLLYGGEARSLDLKKVQVALYYESMCGGCKMMMAHQLYPVYREMSDIMDVELIPYGNAGVEDGKIYCQHGEPECYGNKIQSCALHLFDFRKAFDFIACMEKTRGLPKDSAPECAATHGMDYDLISGCADGKDGEEQLLKMKEKTDALKPPHKYVPWITFNGVHDDEVQKKASHNLKKVVCEAYEGPKPKSCNDKVKVTVYYQTYDDNSKNLIGKQMYPAYFELPNAMEIELVPFGNMSRDCDVEKDQQCLDTAVHSCAIHLYPVDKALAFVQCVENSYDPLNVTLPNCAMDNEMDFDEIEKCAKGEEGKALIRQMAEKTEGQKADSFPWMTVNEGPVDVQSLDTGDLKKIVCDQFSGATPEACKPSKVKVGFYYETLCPFCKILMTEQIHPVYKNFPEYVELELIPYGNVFPKDGKLICQHGDTECTGNIIQSCALHLYKFDQAFDFIACMEAKDGVPEKEAPECAKKYNLDFGLLSQCYKGEDGKQLQKQMGEKTNKLKPKLHYVPWVTINGAHSDALQDATTNLKKFICDTYMGPRPDFCDKKVKVTVFYQTLDDKSKNLLGGQLYPAYAELPSAMEIELVPFGNTSRDCDVENDLQCLGNAIQSCAIHMYDIDKALSFVECVEDHYLPLNQSSPICAMKNELDFEKIEKCAKGEEGTALRKQMADKTEEQKAEYFPWMVFDERPINVPKLVMGDLKKTVCNNFGGETPEACKPSKVKVGFYYETLCPYCKILMTTQINPVYKNLSSIMELELIPYGNVKEGKDGKLQCQHGEKECTGNMIQTCALHHYEFDQALDFITCMEGEKGVPEEEAPKCAKKYDLDFDLVTKCYKGEEGMQLQQQMGEKTKALKPKHSYVPWITINGAHSDPLQYAAQDLMKLVCNVYMGQPPLSCYDFNENK